MHLLYNKVKNVFDNIFLCVPCTEVSGFKVRNKLLGKCLQVQEGTSGGRVSLGECNPYSPSQEWRWVTGSQALSSHLTGECLTAPGEQYEGVHLQPCIFQAESEGTDDEFAAVGMEREANSQEWYCSKKGQLTLIGKGLHLSASQESTLVFLSREHKQVRPFRQYWSKIRNSVSRDVPFNCAIIRLIRWECIRHKEM